MPHHFVDGVHSRFGTGRFDNAGRKQIGPDDSGDCLAGHPISRLIVHYFSEEFEQFTQSLPVGFGQQKEQTVDGRQLFIAIIDVCNLSERANVFTGEQRFGQLAQKHFQ